jgi:L-amino acid N-acyltransferase
MPPTEPAPGPRTAEPRRSPVRVRLAERRDAEAIRAIYNPEVLGSTVTFDLVPRTIDEQVAWLDQHSGGHPAVVAELGDVITGFGSLTAHRSRPAYTTSVESSVYVHTDHRRTGTGRAIVDELLRLAASHGFHAVFARIVGGHTASIELHRVCGFEVIGVEREVGRKFGRWLDVVVMEHLVGRGPAPPPLTP